MSTKDNLWNTALFSPFLDGARIVATVNNGTNGIAPHYAWVKDILTTQASVRHCDAE